MTLARAIVFANGEYSKNQAQRVNASNEDYLLCVDGGIRHCLSEELTPDLLVGDLDSLDTASAKTVERLGIERLQFPAEKDSSDLELALQTLQERTSETASSATTKKAATKIDEVIILGASGGRSDHHLFNWQLLGSREWPFSLRLVDETVDAHVVVSSRPFDKSLVPGQTFSVLPVVGSATGVDVIGARYPLSNATLVPGSTLGLSNLVNETRLQVRIISGIVLVMTVHMER